MKVYLVLAFLLSLFAFSYAQSLQITFLQPQFLQDFFSFSNLYDYDVYHPYNITPYYQIVTQNPDGTWKITPAQSMSGKVNDLKSKTKSRMVSFSNLLFGLDEPEDQ